MNYFIKHLKRSIHIAYQSILKIKQLLGLCNSVPLIKVMPICSVRQHPRKKMHRPQCIKAIVLRKDAKDREYAPEHIEAFMNDPIRDFINAKIFQIQIEEEKQESGVSHSWEAAKKWWEELYNETIDDTIQESTIDNNALSSKTLEQWYQKKQCPQRQQSLTPAEIEVLSFIKHWWNKIGSNSDPSILNQHHRAYKKLLLRHHPDKNGCEQATSLLLEWKEIAKQRHLNAQQQSKISASKRMGRLYGKAKPWKVYSLFAKHQTAVEIQKLDNQTNESHAHQEKLQRKIETILKKQQDLIKSLHQQLNKT